MESDPRIDELEHRVGRLDAELALLRARLDDSAAPTPRATSPTAATVLSPAWAPPQPAPTAAPTPAWSTPTAPNTRGIPHLELDTETVLKWGGVGLVVLAVGFAVSTAISRDWIGPELQLIGALLVGVALIVSGLRLLPTRPAWTGALCSGGVAALFATVASDLFLDQAPDTSAFVATAIITGGGVVLARTVGSEWILGTTLAGGALGWAVIAGDEPPLVATVAWFVVLGAVVVATAVEQGWFAARFLAHGTVMVALLALATEAERASDHVLIGAGTVVVVASLFWIPSMGDLTSVWQQMDVQLSAAAAPWAFGVTFVSALEQTTDAAIGWTAISVSAGAAAVAVLLRRFVRRAHFVSMLIGASVTLSIGLAVLLSTSSTFVAFAVQGAGLVILSRELGHSVRVAALAAIDTLIAMVFVTFAMIDSWVDDASIGNDIAHVLIIAAIAAGAWLSGERNIRRAGAVVTLVLVLAWLGSVLVHLPQGQAAVSVAWALVGTAVLLIGVVRRRTDVAAIGLAVLGLTVGKLLTVDLQEVDTLWRAGLFFLVGIGLMRLGFLLPRLSERSPEPDERAEAELTAEPLEPVP